jgi:hypothetical protein
MDDLQETSVTRQQEQLPHSLCSKEDEKELKRGKVRF